MLPAHGQEFEGAAKVRGCWPSVGEAWPLWTQGYGCLGWALAVLLTNRLVLA